MKKRVVFDFDGTITTRDTTRILIVALAKHRPLKCIEAFPALLRMLLARRRADDLQAAKGDALGTLLRGLTLAESRPILAAFSEQSKPLLRPEVVRALLEHKARGAQVLIVTASPRLAVEAATAQFGVPVIGTEFMMSDGRFTGRLKDTLCYGSHKIDALAAYLGCNTTLPEIDESWSDSWSDYPLMQLAETRIWVANRREAASFLSRDPGSRIVEV